jgi:ribosomal protein L29
MVITMIDEARARRSNWIHRPRFDGSLEAKPPKHERKVDTSAVDWDARISEAIARERQFQHGVLAEIIAELRAEATNDLERATRSLTAELADLKATLAELRMVLASDRSKPLDLPRLPARRELN